ncbi:methyltransferase [Fictibacillus phosphorivorans]|uniref:Methyltransferase n=1 Tax=Fictibacillus phosphorivorans TaxID=1221500 RepID=A0A160INS6_9BACL|nr:class I SAM-dependent methyltransferase [Fictibacillus phosphorivorans]ANC77580.1 methyltransferase [Fictibacillus phosphorivorans]
MIKLERIRQEEKEYHDYCYDHYKLFEKGSWLYKPVRTVMEIVPLLSDLKNIQILDLGSGVGRNSIPLIQVLKDQGVSVDCVDILDSALRKLEQYSQEFKVIDHVTPIKADISTYEIKENTYDLIVAVSSLEHLDSVESLKDVLQRMERGTRTGGINCLIVNSEVTETDVETQKSIDVFMEINMNTNDMTKLLRDTYSNWEILKTVVNPLSYEIVRNQKPVVLATNAITFVVRKK